MVKAYRKIDLKLDVSPLHKALIKKSYLFGEYTRRADVPGSPHREMTDIWLRYKDVKPHLESGDYSTFADEHDAIWYPSFYELPEAKKIIYDLFSFVDGGRLGGVLITKLPPRGQIYPHTDSGWHAEYYEKYYISIANHKGAFFGFDDGKIEPNPGDIYWFDNSYSHWVVNNSPYDRIAMIICLRSG